MSDRPAGQSEGEQHRLSTRYAGRGEWWARCECDRWSVVLVNGATDAEACWREHLDEVAAAVSPVSVEGDERTIVIDENSTLANTYKGNAPILALLKAASEVRDGAWIEGAPTHVLAELLNVLNANGWRLTRKAASPLSPTG